VYIGTESPAIRFTHPDECRDSCPLLSGLAYLGLPYDFKPTAAIPFFVMDKLTFNGNYKKGKANGGTAVTEALLLLLFKNN